MPLTNSFDSPTKEKRTSIESLAEDMKLSSDLKLNEGIECAINVKDKNNTLAVSVIKSDPENSSEKEQRFTLEASTLPVMECGIINTEQIDSSKAINYGINKESKSVPDLTLQQNLHSMGKYSSGTLEKDILKPTEDSSIKFTEDCSTKLTEDCSTEHIEDDSTKLIEDGSTKLAEDVSPICTEDDSTDHIEDGSTKLIEDGSTKLTEGGSSKLTENCTSKSSESNVKPEENNDSQDQIRIGHEAVTDNVLHPITFRASSSEENQAEFNKPKDIGDNVTDLRTTELNQSEEDMCIDNTSPPKMPRRGKKRGRDSETPEAKKRLKKAVANDTEFKVTHPTHPDLTVHGIVLALGEGDVGQLGLGEDIIERARPAHVKIEDKIVQVCAGGMHTVCLTSQGKVYTFGCNDESALGRDTSEEGSETLPVKINLPYKIIQTSAGDSHTAVLTQDGHVYAWGNFRDANGSMGLTSGGIRQEPLEMLPGETVIKIVSGGDHLVCLSNKGVIFTGGCAEQGQLGRVAECFAGRGGRKGVDSILKMGPVRCMKHGSRKRAQFSDIWAGQYVTFAKEKETGDIYSWGLNNYFQLGFSDMKNRFVPERVNSLAEHSKWMKISAGQHHTVLLNDEGKVYTLGRAEYGRLGLGDNPGERSEPALVESIADKKCIDIAAGQSVSLALSDDGVVYSWGMGTSKQLGTGDEEDVWKPVKMAGKQLENRTVIGLTAGGQHTVLLAKDKS